jgi:hypothetical protein
VYEIKAALGTLVAATLLVGCGSSSLTPAQTDAGPRDSISVDGTTIGTRVRCTSGQDLTCNDDPTDVTNRGVCLSDGTCQCLFPCMNSVTGRCLNPTCGCGASVSRERILGKNDLSGFPFAAVL